MTVFHLVRHASHDLLGRVLTGRMRGVPLSASGHAEARRLARHFARRSIAAVLSSPVQRAEETAVPIAAALWLRVVTHDGLDEIDFGDWTGWTFEELQGSPGWDAWNRFRGTAPTPDGETMTQALSRALRVLTDLRRAYGDTELVLVSHQDVLKALLAHCLGMPLDLMHRIDLAPASCSVLHMGDGELRVESMNLLV